MLEMRDFSPDMATLVRQNLPADFKMWWVRGLVLNIQEVERPTENPEKQNPGGRLRDMVLQVSDVDNPDDGYDVRIEGVHHQIEPNDAISLIGHEPLDAARAGYPRFCVNHCTGEFYRAYPISTRLTYGVVPIIEYKYWLSAKTPADFAGKCKNIWVLLLALFLPYLVLLFLSGSPIIGVLLVAVVILYTIPSLIFFSIIMAYINWLTAQPRFSFEGKTSPPLVVHNWRQYVNYNRDDLTPLYENLGYAVQEWVTANPDPLRDFVPVERGVHTVGLLGVVHDRSSTQRLPEKTQV